MEGGRGEEGNVLSPPLFVFMMLPFSADVVKKRKKDSSPVPSTETNPGLELLMFFVCLSWGFLISVFIFSLTQQTIRLDHLCIMQTAKGQGSKFVCTCLEKLCHAPVIA